MSGIVVPVRPKARSSTSGAPATTDIVVGELGVNVRDGTLWMNYTPGGGAQTILQLAGVGVAPTLVPPVAAAKTAAYTALQSDNNCTIVFNSSSALAITLPVLAAGTSFTVAQRGTGKVTWTASGTTVTAYPSGSTGTAGAGAQMTFYYDTTTTILVGGAIS